jgi:hypothetical protein
LNLLKNSDPSISILGIRNNQRAERIADQSTREYHAMIESGYNVSLALICSFGPGRNSMEFTGDRAASQGPVALQSCRIITELPMLQSERD